MISLGTNTTDISARASMDFPLQVAIAPCSDYPNVINDDISYYMYFMVFIQWFLLGNVVKSVNRKVCCQKHAFQDWTDVLEYQNWLSLPVGQQVVF
jgi:hypothetical protein